MRITNKAFSLIELLLVAVLLLVVAGLSIPDLSRAYDTVQLRAASRNISYLMRYAQSLAVIHQKEYRICFRQNPIAYWLEEAVADNSGTGMNGEEKRFERLKGAKGRIFSLPSGVTVDVLTPNIVFYPDATMDRAQVLVRGKNQKEIIISTQERRGQIDVFSPSG